MSERLTFEQILENHTVTELRDILKEAGLKGYSKMKKNEMVDQITALALDENLARKKFLYATDQEIEDLKKAATEKIVIDKDSMQYYYWENLCFAFITQEFEVDIPEEVIKLFEKISKKESFIKNRDRIIKLSKYAMAAANLYGAIELTKLVEIINSQTDLNTSMEELIDVYSWREMLRGCQMFCCQDGFVTDELYGDNIFGIQEDYKNLLAQQGAKPYYIPEKDIFLSYADTMYTEKNEVYNQMVAFWTEKMEQEEAKAEDICNELQLQIRNGAQTQQIFDELDRQKIVFPDDKTIQDFTHCLMDMYNNTRLRENRGFTPVEIETDAPGNSVYSQETYEQIRNLGAISQQISAESKIIPFPTVKREEKKVYPNDPCPCGSGKKYKKCCGRNK